MQVKLKPEAQVVKTRTRWYNAAKSTWLARCVATLTSFDLVSINLRAFWASPAPCVPKRDSFRLLTHTQAVNLQMEKSLAVMPFDEAEMENLLGAMCSSKLDLLHGYWQMSLALEAQEAFTIVTPDWLFSPTRVSQGESNSTSYFPSTLSRISSGLKCKDVGEWRVL